ncbi:MAG: chemotaxis protein CheW [Melioribacteraceae bacterium]
MDNNSTMPSIVFKSKGILFSVPSTYAQAIIQLPEVTELPNTSETVRGIIRHRDEIYNLIDFRKAISYRSIKDEIDEFSAMIDQRETDHIKWLDELEASIIENRPFELTTDPHKCAFGKWYDTYTSENYFIQEVLKDFDAPHRTIHGIAQKIEHLKVSNDIEAAQDVIKETRHLELSKMKELFTKIKEAVKTSLTERVILFNRNNNKFAIAVDQIEAVEDLTKIDTKDIGEEFLTLEGKNFITGLGEDKNKNLIISVAEEFLV